MNPRRVVTASLWIVATVWAVACASTSRGGGGTDTNWTECETDADCEGTARCESRVCVPVGAEAGGAPACPTYPDWPPEGTEFEPYRGEPSDFSSETFGCYPSRRLAGPDWDVRAPLPDCGGNSRCTYEPGDLPCGACAASNEECTLSVWAACDCGQGPFLESYTDQWGCACVNGQWDCRIVAPSGSSCFDACGSRGSGEGGSSGGSGGAPTACGPTLTFQVALGPLPPGAVFCDGEPNACIGGGASRWLTILDAQGRPVATHLDPCGPQACDACSPSMCGPACRTSFQFPPEGESVPWDGTLWELDICGADVQCASPRCAPPGRYTARLCGHFLAMGTGNPLACTDDASLTATCVDVPFDYPSDSTVVGTLTAPGL